MSEFARATQRWLDAFCGSALTEAIVRLCHKSKVFCSSQDVKGGLRCRPHNSKSLISQADGLRVLCASACRPLAGFFCMQCCNFPMKFPVWAKRRSGQLKEREKKTKPTTKTQTFFLSTSAGRKYSGFLSYIQTTFLSIGGDTNNI